MEAIIAVRMLVLWSGFILCSTEEMPDIGCDFEDDSTCGWINTRGLFDQLDWTIHQGPMLSGSTGPSTDHTTGTLQGSYIFLDSTPPVNATDGNYALLMSPVVPATQSGVTGCFRFWYRMYGATTGQLSVYLLDAGQMGGHKVWSLSGQQGDQWLNAAVPLYYTQAFMLVIKGEIRTPSLSDIALDDISYELVSPGSSPCRLDPLEARVNEADVFYLRPPTQPPPVTTYICEECAGPLCDVSPANVTCPEHAPFCSSHIRESTLLQRTVLKGCMSRADCEKGRLNDTDLLQCLKVDQKVTGLDLDCLFCCVGDLCNAGPQLIPPHITWLEEREIPTIDSPVG